jgi:cell division protein ZapA
VHDAKRHWKRIGPRRARTGPGRTCGRSRRSGARDGEERIRQKVRAAIAELDLDHRQGRGLIDGEVDITIAGRHYRVACRDGEEQNLRRAAEMVDAKSREALAGLGALSESRQLLFASLLLADQLIEKKASRLLLRPCRRTRRWSAGSTPLRNGSKDWRVTLRRKRRAPR